MKPLRTILEETRAVRSKLEDEDILCEGIKPVSRMADMPMVLSFRRRSYRPMGAGQTVALYYCSTLDKYLSIPFGPGGALGDNLNLSEETEEEEEYVVESFEDRLERLREDFVSAGMSAAGAAAKAGGATSFLGKVGKFGKKLSKGLTKLLQKAAKGVGDDSSKPTDDLDNTLNRDPHEVKTKNTFQYKAPSDATYQARLKAKASSLQENSIKDLRKMLSEGSSHTTLHINEKDVTLNSSMAKRIVELYDSVNAKNKKQIELMLNEDMASFKKLIQFSIKRQI
jgi:hypothetical protein